MLIFGNDKVVKGRLDDIVYRNFKIYNLSNALEIGIRLNSLIPPFYPMDNKDFDMMYMEYVMKNDSAFMQFFGIIFDIYSGMNVYVMIDSGQYKEFITESLVKLIQQRYGYNAFIVNEPEDFDVARDSDFTVPGIYNMDQDKERFSVLYIQSNPDVASKILKETE